MSRSYTGEAPCPGCGLSGEENPRHRRDELCRNCKDLLEFGREQMKIAKARPPEMPYVKVSIPWHTVHGKIKLTVNNGKHFHERDAVVTITDYRVPYISDNHFERNSKTFLKAYQEFIESFAINDSTKQVVGDVRFGDDSRTILGLIPVNVARKFVLFMDELTKIFEAEKLEEVEKTLKFVQGLNSGSVSVDDFEERNNKVAQKIQELK